MSDVVTPAAPRAARARSVHGVEVLVRWQDRTLERAFLDGQRRRTWTLGERGADFAVSGRWLGVEALEVLRLEGGEARLGWSRRAPLSLTRDGATVPVPGAGAVLGEGEVAQWPLGPLTLEARWTVAPRASAIPLAERLDYRALNIGLAVAAVAALGIARASFAAAEDPGLADGAPAEQARIARFLVAPQRTPRKLPAAEAQAGGDGPAAPSAGREGRKASDPSRPTEAGPTGQDAAVGRARAQLQDLFAGRGGGVLSGVDALEATLARATGNLRSATACSGVGCQGMGLRGDGSGGGGLTQGIGGVGLRTQGRAGGNAGYGRGVGLGTKAGTGTVQLTCPPGERCDGRPEIATDDAILCGTKRAGGCLDKELIRQVLRENVGKVRACYERALSRSQALQGKVAVRFLITSAGAVPESKVASSTVGDPELEACVASRMQTLQFPRSASNTVVTYPYVFRSSGT